MVDTSSQNFGTVSSCGVHRYIGGAVTPRMETISPHEPANEENPVTIVFKTHLSPRYEFSCIKISVQFTRRPKLKTILEQNIL
jgi:hypothetical protein